MRLIDIPNGKSVKILRVGCKSTLSFRLAEMGVVNGCTITVVRRASFNGPMLIKVKDFYLAMRYNDCKYITVGAL
ncbi:MAG: ferrous iron transport protein A [Clostridia bacterium]|nr:ferrous iron transport protein A [Clostridia bacterium]